MSSHRADHENALARDFKEAEPYTLRARVEIPDPEHCLRYLSDHLREDGMDVEEDGNGFRVTTPLVSGVLSCKGNAVLVEASVEDVESLYFIKFWLHEHFSEIAGSTPIKIDWSENCIGLTVPPGFSILTVASARYITPRIRRITFSTTNIAQFQNSDAIHLKIMINFDQFLAQQKGQAHDFVPVWRRYTVRTIDSASHLIAIDFFLHDTDGPGANWAKSAQSGDMVGIASLSGSGFKTADWYLIAGDETSLPAIGRMVETLHANAEGAIIIVVGNEHETQPLKTPANLRIKWIYRDSCADSQAELLAAIGSVDCPKDDRKKLIWAACDVQTARKIRHYLRETRSFTKEEEAVFGYWHRGG
ncbi:NADPH-dependent ferric siderophore reductase [Agrobacterium vitis]|nr:NADPH-dependent ferric siderophore reductase [Agrobacterium vitis]MBE1436390.1 NADPH-dependent ferric siderophore reductase [Agrobacterium vitis]